MLLIYKHSDKCQLPGQNLFLNLKFVSRVIKAAKRIKFVPID